MRKGVGGAGVSSRRELFDQDKIRFFRCRCAAKWQADFGIFDEMTKASGRRNISFFCRPSSPAREAKYRNYSQNNLKQTGLAILNYEVANGELPARASFDSNGKPLLSWRVLVLRYQDEMELYKQFHLDEPWDSEHNKALIDKMPDVYKHPKLNVPGKTVYQAVVGKKCAFDGKDGVKLSSFTDGTSQTIMVVEAAPDKAVPWTKPEDWEMDPNNPLKGLGGLFAGDVFKVLFADGHVQCPCQLPSTRRCSKPCLPAAAANRWRRP